VALCRSAVERVDPEKENRVVWWNVPVKGDLSNETLCRTTCRMLVVDWPAASTGPHPSPDWSACFDSEEAVVVRKRNETQTFFEHRMAGPMMGGPRFGPVRPEELRDWRERYRSLKTTP
jgi:hypothetical protein